MNCPNCGLDNPPNARFCANCGTTLGAAPPPPPAAPPNPAYDPTGGPYNPTGQPYNPAGGQYNQGSQPYNMAGGYGGTRMTPGRAIGLGCLVLVVLFFLSTVTCSRACFRLGRRAYIQRRY